MWQELTEQLKNNTAQLTKSDRSNLLDDAFALAEAKVIPIVNSNPSGTALVWDNVRENWPKLVERFTLNSRDLGSLKPNITISFNTESLLKEMQVFFETFPEAGGAGELSRVRAIENVQNNIKWANSYQSVVLSWLEQQMKRK
ncbi:unnamed protein product, partial [Brenthis ino]